LLTRAAGQNESLAAALGEHGIEPVVIPVLEIRVDTQALEIELARTVFDWVVATSPNGARTVADFIPDSCKVAVVGKTTEEALGRHADLVAEVTNAEGLVEAFPTATVDGGKVLVCRSDLADDTVSAGIADKGWSVIDVVTYSVHSQVIVKEVHNAGNIDLIVLASGSAAQALPIGPRMPGVVCIGPKTEIVARGLGLDVRATAESQDTEGLVAAVLRAVR
jgi:uroporphyrinogen-III synthase